MLKKILTLISSGRATTQEDLVRALNVPEPLLTQMVERLVSQGYLTADAVCVDACEGCSLSMRCGSDRELRIWTLTDKGLAAASD